MVLQGAHNCRGVIMRAFTLIGLAIAGSTAALAAPPAAHNSPDQIVCRLSGSCDSSGTGSSQQKVGDEKAFSLARPGSVKVPTTTKATSVTANRQAPAKRKTSSGGIDMMVAFGTGSADLSAQAKAEARAFAEAMKAPALAGMKFAIDGHTDAVGNRDYNLDLSKRRAQAVTDYLVAQGVDPGRVEPHGFGFDKPRPGTVPTAAVNRRVEFSKAN